jgi:hypothetical protein
MPSRPDATQQEGSALERLLQDLGSRLEQARTVAEQGGDVPVPPTTPGADGPPARTRTLEHTARAARNTGALSKIEDGGLAVRGARVKVDQDDEAAQIVQRRLEQVAARGGALGEADHRQFDQRIRQEPADQTAVRPRDASRERLRQAVLWREILGPPVSLRDEPWP